MHYVGGRYTPESFVKEAKRSGITRRVAANVAGGFHFGDVVYLAYWNGGQPYIFARFVVTSLILPADLALVTASFTDGVPLPGDPVHISRECGQFDLMSGYITSKDIPELVEMATTLANKSELLDPWFMIGGELADEIEPYYIDHKFAQGYIHIKDTPPVKVTERAVFGVENYTRDRNRSNDDGE